MLLQQAVLLELVASRRRDREAEAAAERLRPRGRSRRGAAQLLHLLADRIAPPRIAAGDGKLAH